jgi:hypothetical protein
MVEVTLPEESLSEAEALRLRVRYAAGVLLIATAMGASEVQPGEGLALVLFFTGTHAPTLARHAFQAARLLRERITIDLNLSARLAVHAAGLTNAEVEEAQRTLREQCERLQRTPSTDTIAVSPEVYLVLPEQDRQHLSPVMADDADARRWVRFQEHLNSPAVRRLRYVGFRLQKKEPLSLDIFDVFVVPTVEVRRVRPDFATLADSSERMPTAPKAFSFPEAYRKYRSLVVLGDPGSGKTTLLRWLGAVGAGGALFMHAQLGEGSTLLPLLVSVGRLAEIKASLGDEASVIQAMARYFHERGLEQDEAALAAFLERRLAAGQCLVLLDGLDEVQSESRESLMRWLETFSAQHPQNRYIASARHVGYTGLELPGGAELTLGAFDDAQVRQYVQVFQRAYRRWEEGTADDVTADRDSSRLLDALFANQSLHELSRNPFILSSLSLIHRAEGQLPRHRVQAYEILARPLCETWSHARRLVAGERQEQEIRYEEEAIPILGRLALEMHRHWPTGIAPEQFVIAVLAHALQEREGCSLELATRSAREFLKKAGENVQILLEQGPGQWGFLHLTFQEFFAAVGLHATESFEEEVMAHLFAPRWYEILLLGVGYMALVQKRAEGVRRLVVRILEHKEEGELSFMTEEQRMQVPFATMAATEAGDVLPVPLQERIAREFAHWLCTTPPIVSVWVFMDIRFSEFARRLVEPLTKWSQHPSSDIRERAIHYLERLKASEASSF